MLYGTTIVPTEVMSPADMEKEAAFPLMAVLALKALWGGLMAHGIYSGGKNIAKGNYAAGAFDLATSIPFIGAAGKGLKAFSTMGRIAARGGQVGNIGKRFSAVAGAASKMPGGKGFWGNVARDWHRVKGVGGKGYRALGWAPKSKPVGQMNKYWRPFNKGITELSKGVSNLGRRVEGVGKMIEGTRYGQHMGGMAGLGLMLGGPMAYQAVTGKPMHPEAEGAPGGLRPQDYAHPTAIIRNQFQRHGPGMGVMEFGRMPGFS